MRFQFIWEFITALDTWVFDGLDDRLLLLVEVQKRNPQWALASKGGACLQDGSQEQLLDCHVALGCAPTNLLSDPEHLVFLHYSVAVVLCIVAATIHIVYHNVEQAVHAGLVRYHQINISSFCLQSQTFPTVKFRTRGFFILKPEGAGLCSENDGFDFTQGAAGAGLAGEWFGILDDQSFWIIADADCWFFAKVWWRLARVVAFEAFYWSLSELGYVVLVGAFILWNLSWLQDR